MTGGYPEVFHGKHIHSSSCNHGDGVDHSHDHNLQVPDPAHAHAHSHGHDHTTCGGHGVGHSIFHGKEPQGELVYVYSEANPSYFLTWRNEKAVLAFGNLSDERQQWYKIDYGHKFKDSEGYPGFALVNRVTGKCLTHGREMGGEVVVGQYQENGISDTFLWSLSRDNGNGFKALRPVTNTALNLDADHADKKHGGVRDGNKLIINKWLKQENQNWKIVSLA